MALEKPEVSSENRGPGFDAVPRKIIFTQDELLFFFCPVCVSVFCFYVKGLNVVCVCVSRMCTLKHFHP